MIRSMQLRLLAVVIFAAMAGQTRADQIFNFSFTGNPSLAGNQAGTVTGHLDLSFDGDGTGAASHVTIDSGSGLLPPSFEMMTASSTVFYNSFTVSGGHVISAKFQVNDGINPANQSSLGVELALNNNAGASFLLIEPPYAAPGAFVLANLYGLNGANIVPAPSPSTIMLLASGVFTLGAFHFVRQRQRTASSR